MIKVCPTKPSRQAIGSLLVAVPIIFWETTYLSKEMDRLQLLQTLRGILSNHQMAKNARALWCASADIVAKADPHASILQQNLERQI
jgi:hypothetical protein